MSGEAVKRLDRLAPNSVHVCGFIWEWTYAKKNCLTIPHGDILGGFRGSTRSKKPGKCGQAAGAIGNKSCTYNAGESGNGHRLNKLAP